MFPQCCFRVERYAAVCFVIVLMLFLLSLFVHGWAKIKVINQFFESALLIKTWAYKYKCQFPPT